MYFSASSASVISLCPQLVETDGLRIAASKSHIRSDQCQDSAVKVVGCRSHETLEFLSTCETAREHMSKYNYMTCYFFNIFNILKT